MSDNEQEIQTHIARNRELLKLFASKGIDAAVSRSIDLHFWTSNESAASKLSAALEQRGYSRVATNRSVHDLSLWNVAANFETSPLSVTAPSSSKHLYDWLVNTTPHLRDGAHQSELFNIENARLA